MIPQLTLVIISALKAIPVINTLLLKISHAKGFNVSYEIVVKYLRNKVKFLKKTNQNIVKNFFIKIKKF